MPNNHFTATNLASDIVHDSPTSNFCTLNTISGPPRGAITFSEGNLKATGGYDSSAGYYPRIMGTMAASSGKWFYEARVNTTLASAYEIGFKGINTTWPAGSHGLDGGSSTWSTESEIGYSDHHGGIKHCNSSTPETTDAGSYGTAGTVIGLAIDLDASPQTMKVWNEGTGYDSADLPTGGSDAFYPCIDLQSTTSGSLTVNFGQDATFAGTESGTTYTTDASGGDTGGEFTMQPPAGYKAWTTANLPTPTIAKPAEHFSTTLYSGNGGTQSITTGLAPDLLWIKNRGASNMYHQLFDSVRGLSAGALASNSTDTEDSVARIASLDSTGFTTSSTDYSYTNSTGNTYVAWSWKAGTSPSTSHTYALDLDLTASYGGGWGDFGNYDTPRLKVYEDRGSGNVFLGYATVTSSDDYSASYVINTNNKLAIEIIWEYDDSNGGMNSGYPEYPAGTLKDGSTTMATWTAGTPDVTDGATFIAKTSGETASGTGTLVASTGGATGSSYNADAGFSIVTYTGNDYAGAQTEQTIDHNLGVAPEMVIVKGRTDEYGQSVGWGVYHKDLTTDYLLYLNSTDAESYGAGYAYIKNIDATSVDFAAYYGDGFNFGGDSSYSADDFVAYFFASVAGFSKCGSYVSNGLADGTFIALDFAPAFLLVKSIDNSSTNWQILDNKRNTTNPANDFLRANTDIDEQSNYDVDFLSNGLKIRTTDSDYNSSGTYLFYAVGQSSKYASAR